MFFCNVEPKSDRAIRVSADNFCLFPTFPQLVVTAHRHRLSCESRYNWRHAIPRCKWALPLWDGGRSALSLWRCKSAIAQLHVKIELKIGILYQIN